MLSEILFILHHKYKELFRNVLGNKNSTFVEKGETIESRAGWWEDREHVVRKNSRYVKQVIDFSLAILSRLNKLDNYR